MQKIAIISTVPMMINFFLLDHIQALNQKYKIYIFTNLSENKSLIGNLPHEVEKIDIKFSRKINIISDLICTIKLIFFFKKLNINLVLTVSPKGGLLGIISSKFSKVPVRVHYFTGQHWLTKNILLKKIYIFFDKLINLFCTNILVDSYSQKDFLVKSKIIKSRKSSVLGLGSISGVNLEKFKPNARERLVFRKKLKIPIDDIVILYMGRLNRDKGIIDLVNAFNKIQIKNIKLLIVGPDEEKIIKKICNRYYTKNILFFPFTTFPQNYYNISDIFCLPSYREGFGTSIIESSAYSIPSIGRDIYGINDSIIANKTGLIFSDLINNSLENKLKELIKNKNLRLGLGKNAKERVLKYFDSKYVISNFLIYIESILKCTKK